MIITQTTLITSVLKYMGVLLFFFIYGPQLHITKLLKSFVRVTISFKSLHGLGVIMYLHWLSCLYKLVSTSNLAVKFDLPAPGVSLFPQLFT